MFEEISPTQDVVIEKDGLMLEAVVKVVVVMMKRNR